MTEEDSEKRFHSVMDKLFNTPPPKSISRNQSSRSRKRGGNSILNSLNSDSNISRGKSTTGLNRSLVPVAGLQTPLCRPWDRGDFMKRLATFKSLTWFGKPKVVSAVNCARRGWINVEMDIIACEACGARLLFSNPSSWTHQQIEKAAAVFSLKLDSGHALLCPWIDNACDESITQFPPTPAPALIDGYKGRSSALLQLSALPIVSSSAIDSMRCPELERFLEQSSIDYGVVSTDATRTEHLDHGHADSTNLYFQAQKLISLCGWEPRSLPYAVDCKDRPNLAAQNGHSEGTSPHIVNVQDRGVVLYEMSGTDVMDVEDDPSRALQSDPASVVFDCKLCGASAGLWAFSTVPRPLECFKVVQSLEVNGQTGNYNANVINRIAGAATLDSSGKHNHVGHSGGETGMLRSTEERSLNSNLSIAGGPPPAKQNYRATVHLPIISRHLRADLSSKANVRSHAMSIVSSMDHEMLQCNSVNFDSLQQENDRGTCKLIVRSEDMGTSLDQRNEDELGACRGNDHSFLGGADSSRNDENEECLVIEQEVPSRHALDTCSGSRVKNPVESSQKSPSAVENNENMGISGNAEMAVINGSQGNECGVIVVDADSNIENQMVNGNNPLSISRAEVPLHPLGEVSSEARQVFIPVSSNEETNYSLDIACAINLDIDVGSVHQKSLDSAERNKKVDGTEKTMQLAVINDDGTNEKVEGVKNMKQLTLRNENVAAHDYVKYLKRARMDQTMEFDPIRQHRHFCPWIVSTAKTGPGWRLTLSALDRAHATSQPSLPLSSSLSMFEGDDPITSVRNLFKSPSTKKSKTSHDSR